MIPEADQPSETPSDIANRKMAQAEKKLLVFGKKFQSPLKAVASQSSNQKTFWTGE
ncbi:hypothetical protein [Endozoicomonas sp. ALC013]|uniref:hypothetical protein n=1 Tax=Endozoicomonas sp. ALC013 TaxID=3403076 RepID=UPI003BB51448